MQRHLRIFTYGLRIVAQLIWHQFQWTFPMVAYRRIMDSWIVPEYVKLICEGDAAQVYAYRSDTNGVGVCWARKSVMEAHFDWWDSTNVWKSGSSFGKRLLIMIAGFVGVPFVLAIDAMIWAAVFPGISTFAAWAVVLISVWAWAPTWVFARDFSTPYDIWPIRRRQVRLVSSVVEEDVRKSEALLRPGQHIVEEEEMKLLYTIGDELTDYAKEYLVSGHSTGFVAETADGNVAREIADPEFFAKHGPFRWTMMKGLIVALFIGGFLLAAIWIIKPSNPPTPAVPTATPTVEAIFKE